MRRAGVFFLGWGVCLFLVETCLPLRARRPLGTAPEEARAFLLLHDWYGESPVATPSFIRSHFEFLDSRPFDGVAIYLRTPDLSLNVTATILSQTRLGCSAIASVLAPLKGLSFRNLTQNFAAVVGGRPPDFFDDWSAPIGNFADLAQAAHDAGLRGLYIDNEPYESPWTHYPDGVAHPEKPLGEYRDQARLRGRQAMEAMISRFPDIIVIMLHGPYISEPEAPAPLFPQWQSRNQLSGPLFAGMVEGAGGGATVVDGGELYHLRTLEEFEKSYDWRKTVMPSEKINCAFILPAIRPSWEERVSVGFGVSDRDLEGHFTNPQVLATTLARALRRADRYVWFYVEGRTFLSPAENGGAPEPWVEAVRKGKAQGANRSSR